MYGVIAGEILLAKDAIEATPYTDLGPPIEIPDIPKEAFPENISEEQREFWKSEILRLKKERNALILAHNYQAPDVQDVADVIGDSLKLAQRGRESDADVLVEAAVLFMNQILFIMKKPHQTVLAPSLKALCSLAAHVDLKKIREWKAKHPDGKVVSYVNTYVEVKAESDYCCASANSAPVIRYVAEKYPASPILFLPDVYFGFYAADTLKKMGQSIDQLYLMMGACHVHDMIRAHHVRKAMLEHPGAAVVVHPECGCTSACVRQLDAGLVSKKNMEFRSTQSMIDALKDMPQKEVIVATEIGNIKPMSKAAPDKIFIPANPEAVCAFMKQNTLKNLYESLRDMKYEIKLDPELAKQAKLPITRMLEIV